MLPCLWSVSPIVAPGYCHLSLSCPKDSRKLDIDIKRPLYTAFSWFLNLITMLDINEKLSQYDFMNSYWFLIILSSLKLSIWKFMLEFQLTNEPLFWNNKPFPLFASRTNICPFLRAPAAFHYPRVSLLISDLSPHPGKWSVWVHGPSWPGFCLPSPYLLSLFCAPGQLSGHHTAPRFCGFVHIVSSTLNTVSPFSPPKEILLILLKKFI